MTNQRRVCPVCLQEVHRTRAGNIHGHFNSLGRICPGDELPFRTTLPKTENHAQLRRRIRAERQRRRKVAHDET